LSHLALQEDPSSSIPEVSKTRKREKDRSGRRADLITRLIAFLSVYHEQVFLQSTYGPISIQGYTENGRDCEY